MGMLRTLSCVAFLCIATAGLTQDTTARTYAIPFTISGYIDAYYRYAGNKVGSLTSFTPTHDAFSLGMANLVLSGQKGKVGYLVDLGIGPRALEANYTDQGILQALKQLYLTYALHEKVKLTLGNFATFVGYESIDAPLDKQYSTGYLFSKGPFFHTGLKADYIISPKWSAMLGIFDDTDSKFDVISKKHIGTQLTYDNGRFKSVVNFLSGREREDSVRTHKTLGHQIDWVGTYQITTKTALGLNLTNKFAVQPESALPHKSAQWRGVACYFNQTISNAFTLALRGEWVDDADGLLFGTSGNKVKEITLTGNWSVSSLMIMPEIRWDFASEPIFVDYRGSMVSSYPSFLMAAYYKF